MTRATEGEQTERLSAEARRGENEEEEEEEPQQQPPPPGTSNKTEGTLKAEEKCSFSQSPTPHVLTVDAAWSWKQPTVTKRPLAVPECAPLHRCLRRRRREEEGGREGGKWHKQALYSVASRWQYDYKENNGGHIH